MQLLRAHITVILILLLGFSPLNEQEMPIPVKDQVPLFLKILTYDKNLSERGDELVLGVIYQERYRASVRAKDEVVAVTKNIPAIDGRTLRVVPIVLQESDDLVKRIEEAGVNTLYVAPLRAYDVGEVGALADKLDIPTLSGMPSYIPEGIAVGLRLVERKPKIMVNLPAAKAQGAEFSVQLLRLAEVLR